MTSEQQIEEIARTICSSSANKGKCDTCGFHKTCSKFEEARDVYAAGYYKRDGWHTGVPTDEGEYITASIDANGEETIQIRQFIHWANGFSWYYSWEEKCAETKVTHWMPQPDFPKIFSKEGDE